MRVAGPAIVAEPTSTLVVPPGSEAVVTAQGHYLLEVGAAAEAPPETDGRLDATLLAVIANRLDAVVREMTNTLLRSGRSAVLAMARDFSCSIVTGDDELLAAAEGIPVHIVGSHLQSQAMRELHPVLREGDAYLDNDPYRGNTHHADHTILVPVFHEGEHLFTCVAKAHQADTGNSQPTTYMALARDIYEEGALNFPCVQIQRDYRDVDDVIRMCRNRIRVPDQWYGDYLATLGAARIGERRLKELVAKYGAETIRAFVRQWLDYSELRARSAIAKLPAGTVTGHGVHDGFGPIPDGIPVRIDVTVDHDRELIEIDLRDNIDCVPAGVNESRACSTNNSMTGVFNVLEPDIPKNAGSFRRVQVLLRENCVVGIPRHPTCCSVATTNVGDVLVNTTQRAFSEIGDGWGAAEGGSSLGVGFSVVSGHDRRTGGPFINQLFAGNNGGPATPANDGWLVWTLPVGAGMLYRDSVEVDEQKYPLRFGHVRLAVDSGGAGRTRGGLSAELSFTPTADPMTVIWVGNGVDHPPVGARGGGAGSRTHARTVLADGTEVAQSGIGMATLQPGEWIVGGHCGGGGYGDPTERPVERVLHDVREGWVSREAATAVYGVVVTGSVADDTLAVDPGATARRRAELGGQP
ncbi:MAG: hydantoinase B/oxoprolinase family protein [Thermoleophilia bacterium]